MQSLHTERDGQQQDIQVAAYYLWQQRGCPFGTPQVDWFRAEAQFREQHENASDDTALLAMAKTVGSALGSVAAHISFK
jgi:hypothetical protein